MMINPEPEQDKELKIKMLFIHLEEKGIVKIEIKFDGSGDSGSIDDEPEFYTEGINGELIKVDLALARKYDTEDDIGDQLIDLGYHILDKYYGYDWYNNDGGYGVININVKEKSWYIEGFQRYIDTKEASTDVNNLEDALSSFIIDK